MLNGYFAANGELMSTRCKFVASALAYAKKRGERLHPTVPGRAKRPGQAIGRGPEARQPDAFLALATLALECQSPDIQSTEFSNPESEDDWANQTTTQHETRSRSNGTTERRCRGTQNGSRN